MIVLGIETSCDETAAAIVDSERVIRAERLLSQVEEHKPYGGIVPEIAARSHLDHVDRLTGEAMEEAGCELAELVPIATVFPSAGACSEQVRLFCGRVTGAAIGEARGLDEEGEDILVHSVPVSEALEMLAADHIPNGHTLISLLWFQNHVDSLRERWR